MPPQFQRRDARFAARRLFRDGVEIVGEWNAQPYKAGELRLIFQQDRKGITRAVARFERRKETFATDIFPPLWSAKLVAICDRGLRLDGWEPTGERYQRQAWHIVFV